MEEERPTRSTVFGSLLRRYRLAAGLSQQALAERARMSERGIGALERGDRRTPQRETLALLADALALEGEQRREFEAAANPSGSRRVGGGSVATGPWPAAPTSNLPFAVTTFVGRKREISDIMELVREHRLVTLTGPGGIGKTRTALEIGAALLDEDSDIEVRLTELASIADASRVASAIASSFGVQEAPNRPLLEVLLTFFEHKRVLIILDNCEHVIDEARNVTAALLRRSPELRILATSREALNLAGEHLYPLPPLPAPASDAKANARELLAFEGPQLFVERATAADPHFTVSNENAPHVAEICRRLDGMPLALELAAARAKMFSAEELAQQLDDRFRLLTSSDRIVPARQRTIRALIDWSYDLLSAQEQRLFRTLAIFADGFTLATVSGVWGRLNESEEATLELLSSLLDKSLVQKEPADNQTRYRLLESMKHYAREALVARGEFAPAAQAHAAVFLALAEKIADGFNTDPEDDRTPKDSPERGNWRAALQWSLAESGDLALGRRLISTLRWVLNAFSPMEHGKWTAMAIETIDADTPADIVVQLCLTEANYCAWLNHVKASLAAAERALAHLGPSSDVRDLAEAKWRAGGTLAVLGFDSEGLPLLREALAAFRELDLPKLVVWTLIGLTGASINLDDVTNGRTYCTEALAIAIAHRFNGAVNAARGTLADLEFRAGDTHAALLLAGDALAEARSTHREIQQAYHSCNMAMYSLVLGNSAEARSYAREALDVSRKIGTDYVTAVVLQRLAAIAALRPQRDPTLAARDRVRAGRLIGYVDVALGALGASREFNEVGEYDRLVAALSESLGSDKLATLMKDGGRWPVERAVSEALLI